MDKGINVTNRRPLRQVARRYMRREDGSLMVLGLIFFVLILMVAGISVDLIRHEQKRVQVQSVADRAVLAAASLTQPQDITAVVEDYFEREGLLQYLVEVDPGDNTLNMREVRVVTRAAIPSLFTQWIGLNRLESAIVSRAEERVSDVEVTMVLDLSNSMNQFDRIENLRIAGEEFITTLYENTEDHPQAEDRISVSVVPYTGQVNAGHQLLGYFNTTYDHPYSACALFSGSDYTELGLSQTAELTGAGHFDPWHMDRNSYMSFCPNHPGGIRGTMNSSQFAQYAASMGLTTSDADFEPMDVDTAEIMIMEDDPDALRRRLRSLIADGNTSIEIGMKWAAALMDPSADGIIQDLISQGMVNDEFDDRPFEYDNADAVKTIVLMTDGENWDEWRMADQFKQGPSRVWHSFERPGNANAIISQLVAQGAHGPAFRWPDKPSAQPVGTRLSVRDHTANWWSQNQYFIPARNTANPMNGTWSQFPDRHDSSCVEYGPNRPVAQRTPFRFYACNNWILQELDHRELWATLPVRWVGAYLYHYPNIQNYWNWMDQRLSSLAPAAKNERLYNICDRLRAQGVRVYAVAFEAPPNGVEAMRRCAYTENHFFDVDGLEIEQAFRTIAGSIQRLRLTE